MAAFDLHKRCARCRDNGKGEDLCVKGLDCTLCDSLSPDQVEQLAVAKYQAQKSKAGSVLSGTVSLPGPVEKQLGKCVECRF